MITVQFLAITQININFFNTQSQDIIKSKIEEMKILHLQLTNLLDCTKNWSCIFPKVTDTVGILEYIWDKKIQDDYNQNQKTQNYDNVKLKVIESVLQIIEIVYPFGVDYSKTLLEKTYRYFNETYPNFIADLKCYEFSGYCRNLIHSDEELNDFFLKNKPYYNQYVASNTTLNYSNNSSIFEPPLWYENSYQYRLYSLLRAYN